MFLVKEEEIAMDFNWHDRFNSSPCYTPSVPPRSSIVSKPFFPLFVFITIRFSEGWTHSNEGHIHTVEDSKTALIQWKEDDTWKIHYTRLLAFSQFSQLFHFFSPKAKSQLQFVRKLKSHKQPMNLWLATKLYQNKNLIIIKVPFHIGSCKSICIYNSYANAL